jgi:hypothetical protein
MVIAKRMEINSAKLKMKVKDSHLVKAMGSLKSLEKVMRSVKDLVIEKRSDSNSVIEMWKD